MAEPSTHNNYSFEDIQRYLQGGMSATEMHEIEKAALQDPFLADAIEGYSEVPSTTARQHLNEINAALQNEKQESKVIPIKKNNQWLRIAVIIILLAGVGVIGTYFFKTSNNTNQIAQVKKEEANKQSTTKDSVETVMPETTSLDKSSSPVVAENKKQQKINSGKKAKARELYINADTINKDEKNTVATLSSPYEKNAEANKAFAPLPAQKNNDSAQILLQGRTSGLNIASNKFAGKVVDENNNPIAGTLIQSADKKAGTYTDVNGNFSLQKNDTVLKVTASNIGYNTRATKLQAGNNVTIVLKGTNAGLNETVITTALGVKKQRKAAGDSAMPVGGWQNFNNYVVSQLNKDSTGKENYISNDDVVELEFLIDGSGNPYNIQVTKPLDNEKNSKAINILKSGPKWTGASKKKKAKVAIAF